MAILAVLVALMTGPFLLVALARKLCGKSPVTSDVAGRVGIALLFTFTGIGHFLLTEKMAAMLPEWFASRVQVVYATGVLEIAAGLAILWQPLRQAVGIGLVLMLLAFLPVNIYAAIHRIPIGGHEGGINYLLIRVPVQFFLVGWVGWFSLRRDAAPPADS